MTRRGVRLLVSVTLALSLVVLLAATTITSLTSTTVTTTNMDASGRVTLPSGAAVAIGAAGEVNVDTTASQLVFGGAAGAAKVLEPLQQTCAVVTDLAAADDNFEFWQANQAVTITSVGCRCRGTCTGTATFTLEDRAGNAMTITGTNPTCATSGNATYAAVTAANGLVAGEGIAFDVTNTPNPETDEYTICVTYTVDRQ